MRHGEAWRLQPVVLGAEQLTGRHRPPAQVVAPGQRLQYGDKYIRLLLTQFPFLNFHSQYWTTGPCQLTPVNCVLCDHLERCVVLDAGVGQLVSGPALLHHLLELPAAPGQLPRPPRHPGLAVCQVGGKQWGPVLGRPSVVVIVISEMFSPLKVPMGSTEWKR